MPGLALALTNLAGIQNREGRRKSQREIIVEQSSYIVRSAMECGWRWLCAAWATCAAD
jgi:hypothetical protein